MPLAISWTDLVDKKVAIWGYGVEGKASHDRLKELGVEPLIVDDGVDSALSFDDAVDEMLRCDYVIKSPGISRHGPQAKRVSAVTNLVGSSGLWMASVDQSKVICVTGTKGKSTTSALCAEILAALGYDVFFGGNIGSPAFAPEAGTDWDYWVIETSSYQVMDLEVGPKVVGLTSLHPDHLPWHLTEEQYYSDKLSITKLPGVESIVANKDDETLSARPEVKSNLVEFTSSADVAEVLPTDTALRGEHNRSNMALAIRCVENLLGETDLIKRPEVQKAIVEFAGLPHRFQTVASSGGVDFINDSLSTNTLPTIAALNALAGERVAIVVGGYDRGVDQGELIDALGSAVGDVCIVCIPDTGTTVYNGLQQSGTSHDVVKADSMKDGVEVAYDWACEKGGVVLLSPAAASFNEFSNYKERGEAFVQIAKDLVNRS